MRRFAHTSFGFVRDCFLRNRGVIAISLVSAVAIASCDMGKLTVNTTSKVLARAKPSSQQESDIETARMAMPATLKTIEGFHVVSPENEILIALLAEGWCQYTTAFVQGEWEQAIETNDFERADALAARGTKLDTRCVNYSFKMLGGNWEEAVFGEIDALRAKLTSAGKDQVPGMLWLGIGLASTVNMNRDKITIISYLPKAKMILERVIELDDDYNMGLAHMALGMMYSFGGKAIGGNPDKAKLHFERSIEITEGKFLLTRVMYARHFGVAFQQRDFFHAELVKVLQTSPAVFPEQRLANELAHERALRYLKREKEWF